MTFESGFDTPKKSSLANAMSLFWSEVVERNRAGKPSRIDQSINCNQEPCYEELVVQRLRGVAPKDLRAAAMRHRRELNGGFTPFSPATVQMAVDEAAASVEYARNQVPALEGTENLFRSPA